MSSSLEEGLDESKSHLPLQKIMNCRVGYLYNVPIILSPMLSFFVKPPLTIIFAEKYLFLLVSVHIDETVHYRYNRTVLRHNARYPERGSRTIHDRATPMGHLR